MKAYGSAIALNGAVFLFMCGVGMMVALLPQRIMALSGSIADVGYLASAFAIPYILFQLPIGNLADRFGFRIFLSSGYFLCACTGVLYYFAGHPCFVFLGRMIQGIGEAPLWALAPALLSVQFPTKRGRVMGLYNAAIHVGLTVGSLLGVGLLRVWHGNEAFLLFASVSVVGGVLILSFVKDSHAGTRQNMLQVDYRQLLALIDNRHNMTVLFGILLYGAGYGIFLTILPAFLLEIRHFPQAAVGFVFTLFYVALSVSQIVTGPFTDWKGAKYPMIIGMLLTASGFAACAQLQRIWLYAVVFVASCGLGIFAISAMTFLNQRVPDALKGTISGAFYMAWGIGFFFGPMLLGKFVQAGNFRIGFWGLASLCFLEVLELVVSDPRKYSLASKN